MLIKEVIKQTISLYVSINVPSKVTITLQLRVACGKSP